MRSLIIVAMLASSVHADDLCAPDRKRSTRTIDLDLKDAPVHDVLRLLADTAKINLVVSDSVAGKVTVRLKKVSWDRAACVIAATQKLRLDLDGNVLIVTPSGSQR